MDLVKRVSILDCYKFKPPKIFVIRDTQGREWTTREGLKYLRGVYAADSKKFFYNLDEYRMVKK